MSEPRIPLVKHPAKLLAQHGEAQKLLVQILQLRRCQRTHFPAGRSPFFPDLQESRQLVQREPYGEGMLHQPDPIYRLGRVLAVAVGGALGMKDTQPFIVAKRIRAEPAEPGQFRGSKIILVVVHFHNYGI